MHTYKNYAPFCGTAEILIFNFYGLIRESKVMSVRYRKVDRKSTSTIVRSRCSDASLLKKSFTSRTRNLRCRFQQ